MGKQFEHQTTIVGIAGTSNEDVYLLANLYQEPLDPEEIFSVVGRLSHRPLEQGTVIYDTETWLTSMDRSNEGSLFTVSAEGELHFLKQGKWSVLDLNCPDGLNAVWAAANNKVFAVGSKGERVQITDNSINLTKDSMERCLNAVHGISAKNVFAVGDEGLIFIYDGIAWKELETVTNCSLLDVLCLSENEVYIGGDNGVLLRWNGKELNWLESPKITITSLAWYQGKLYAAAGQEGVYVLGSNGLEEFKDLTIDILETIDDLLFGVAGKFVVQFNGSEWWGGDLDL